MFQELTNLENELLAKTIPTQDVQVDPAPFQLVEETSLYKAHSLFALLGLSHSFVTKNGKLVGVVTLADVRQYRHAFSNLCVCVCVHVVCVCVSPFPFTTVVTGTYCILLGIMFYRYVGVIY